MIRVLIVDDIRNLAEQYAYDLARLGGFETKVAASGKEALEIVAFDPVDCVILDLEMPGIDGFEVLRTMTREGYGIPVIVYTGTGDYDRCVQAVRLGAASFIDKSEPMERVVHEVETALERARLRAEVKSLRGVAEDTALVGSSGPMRELAQRIGRVAAISSTVLIVGESGTGKEVVARELHRLGPRAEGPFVAINSAALPENLVESELFGHERGAFTGASRTHRGAFERASGGTLFLDEIGELPSPVQAKLLRVLEQNEITRVGAERAIKVDARVIAATHRDLEADATAGRFRGDLFYRLNVHVLRVPPLRDRRSDIPELANHFLTAVCARFGVARKRFDREALDALMAYDWSRNNVRELRNIVERVVLATRRGRVRDRAGTPIFRHSPRCAAATLLLQSRHFARTFKDRKGDAVSKRSAGSSSRGARVRGLERHAVPAADLSWVSPTC